MKTRTLKFILSIVLIAAITAFSGCSENSGKQSQSDNTSDNTSDSTELGTEPANEETADNVDNDDVDVDDGDDFFDDAEDIGTGENFFRLKVEDSEDFSLFNVYTNEETVGAALLNAGFIEGEESAYGLYVKKVNGIAADFDKDGAYWAFYINGEYALTGADSTTIEEDMVYAFVYEEG